MMFALGALATFLLSCAVGVPWMDSTVASGVIGFLFGLSALAAAWIAGNNDR